MISNPREPQLLGIKTQKGGISYGEEETASRADAVCFRFKRVSFLELISPR